MSPFLFWDAWELIRKGQLLFLLERHMATLINKVTEQKVEGVDAAHFLANVEDAANWVEQKDGEVAPAAKKPKAKPVEPEAE